MRTQSVKHNGRLARVVWHRYCHDTQGQHPSWIADSPGESCPACEEESMEQTRLLEKLVEQMKSIIGWQVLTFGALVVLLWRSW